MNDFDLFEFSQRYPNSNTPGNLISLTTCVNTRDWRESFYTFVKTSRPCHYFKGSVQQKLSGILLYIIQKLSLRPIITGHNILISLKRHFPTYKKQFSINYLMHHWFWNCGHNFFYAGKTYYWPFGGVFEELETFLTP